MGDTASSHQADSESQPPKRPVTTVASRIVSVLGVECGLDPKTVSLSEVSDWMEKSAYVIRICGEMYKPPHKWSNLRGSAKLWSASAVRDLSVLGDPWVKIRAQYNVPVAMGVAQAVNHIVAESARRRAMYQENCRHLHKVVDKIEIESRHYLAIPAIMAAACRCGDLPPFFQVLVACWPGERILMGLMVSASLYRMLVCQPEVESSLSEKQTAAVIRIKQGMHGGPAHAAKVLARFTRPVALVAHGTPWVLQALTAAVEHRAFLDANDGTTDAAGGLRFEALHLVGTALDDAALHTLADRVLGKICAGSLARISLRDNGFGASGAAHLAAALRRHARSLQDIDLSSNLLGCVGERPQMGFLELTEGVPTCMEAGIIPLAKTLSECVELRCLQLSAAKLGSRGALALRNLASVTLSTRLTTLNLSGNSIQEPAAGLLLLSLSQPPGAGVLRKLNFSENAVESLQSFSALAQLLAPPSCARPRFGAGNVFGGTFGGCRGLTSLQLRGCGMDDKGIELWCALLEQEGGGGGRRCVGGVAGGGGGAPRAALALTDLNLCNNRIASQGAACLSDKLLRHCCALTRLNLASNSIDIDGAISLGSVLQSSALASLATLVLDKNGIRDEGARAILQALPSCTALTVLSTRGNFLTVDTEHRLRLAVPAWHPAVFRALQRGPFLGYKLLG